MSEVRQRAIERVLLVVLSGVLIYFSNFRDGVFIYGFHLWEGGVWIDEAARVLAGEVMYRDFFEFVTPGIVYLNAALLWLFGRRVEVMAWAAVGMGTLLVAGLHDLACRAIPSCWRLLPPVAFAAVAYTNLGLGNHKWPALLFAIVGLTLLAARPGAAPWAGAGAGALLAFSVLCTLDYGVGVTLGVAAYLAVCGEPRRKLALFCVGWLAVFVGVMGFFAVKAGLGTVVYDTVVFPLTYYRQRNPFFLALGGPWRPRNACQMGLALGAVGSAIAVSMRGAASLGGGAHASAARLVAFAGLGLIAVSAHRPLYPATLIMRCTPLLVCLAAVLGVLQSRGRRWRMAVLACSAPVALGLLWGVAASVLEAQRLIPLVRERHRAGEVWLKRPIPELSWVESQTQAGEPVFLLPVKGGLYFLSGTRDPTSFPYIIQGQNPPQHLTQVVVEIERARPALGVWNRRSGLAAVYRALLATYEPVDELDSGNVLLRRRSSPAH